MEEGRQVKFTWDYTVPKISKIKFFVFYIIRMLKKKKKHYSLLKDWMCLWENINSTGHDSGPTWGGSDGGCSRPQTPICFLSHSLFSLSLPPPVGPLCLFNRLFVGVHHLSLIHSCSLSQKHPHKTRSGLWLSGSSHAHWDSHVRTESHIYPRRKHPKTFIHFVWGQRYGTGWRTERVWTCPEEGRWGNGRTLEMQLPAKRQRGHTVHIWKEEMEMVIVRWRMTRCGDQLKEEKEEEVVNINSWMNEWVNGQDESPPGMECQ